MNSMASILPLISCVNTAASMLFVTAESSVLLAVTTIPRDETGFSQVIPMLMLTQNGLMPICTEVSAFLCR